MTYARVDDQFTEHPKVLEVGPLGEALWLRGLLYASRNLTDGFVPTAYLRRMGDMDAIEQADRLEKAGLWHGCEGGYRIHDYADWQRSKEEVAAISQVRAEAGRRGGLARASNEANAKQVASKPRSKTQAYTDTASDTDTDTEQNRVERAGADAPPGTGAAGAPKPKRSKAIDADWTPDDTVIRALDDEGFRAGEVHRELIKFHDHFKATGKPMKDWNAAFKNWMRRSREFAPARASPNGKADDLTYYAEVAEPDPERERAAERERKASDHWRELQADKSLTIEERQQRQKAYRASPSIGIP